MDIPAARNTFNTSSCFNFLGNDICSTGEKVALVAASVIFGCVLASALSPCREDSSPSRILQEHKELVVSRTSASQSLKDRISLEYLFGANQNYICLFDDLKMNFLQMLHS